MREILDRWYRKCIEYNEDSDAPSIDEALLRTAIGGFAAITSEPEAHRLDIGSAAAYCSGGDIPDGAARARLVQALALARRALRESPSVLHPTNEDDARTVDCLVDHFFAESQDLLTWASESWVNVRHYVTAAELIATRCPEVSTLWSFIFTGRGVGRPDGMFPYCSKDEQFYLSYWTRAEVTLLHESLDRAFAEMNWASWNKGHPAGAVGTNRGIDSPELALIIARDALANSEAQAAGMIIVAA